MAKDFLHQPYELVLNEPMAVCPRAWHQVSFFELVYIVSGTGQQSINDNSVSYQPGDLFLLAPQDAHQFTFQTTTQLFFIRFTTSYLRQQKAPRDLLTRLEMALTSSYNEPGGVIHQPTDWRAVQTLMNTLLQEYQDQQLYSPELIEGYLQAILLLVARNAVARVATPAGSTVDRKAMDLIHYVQANIYDPPKLRGASLSQQFGIAETYLGRFFRQQAGESLQAYITKYRLKLLVNRLLHSDLRMSELAHEFGFTDKSHLNRFFKKHHALSPAAYRKWHVKNQPK